MQAPLLVILSVYNADKAHPRVTHHYCQSNFVLSPRGAIAALQNVGYKGGTVFQDNVTLRNGQVGTVAYRVYPSGRYRRYFWIYDDPKYTVEAQRIRLASQYQPNNQP